MERCGRFFKALCLESLKTDVATVINPGPGHRGQEDSRSKQPQLPPLRVFVGCDECTKRLNAIVGDSGVSCKQERHPHRDLRCLIGDPGDQEAEQQHAQKRSFPYVQIHVMQLVSHACVSYGLVPFVSRL